MIPNAIRVVFVRRGMAVSTGQSFRTQSEHPYGMIYVKGFELYSMACAFAGLKILLKTYEKCFLEEYMPTGGSFEVLKNWSIAFLGNRISLSHSCVMISSRMTSMTKRSRGVLESRGRKKKHWISLVLLIVVVNDLCVLIQFPFPW